MYKLSDFWNQLSSHETRANLWYNLVLLGPAETVVATIEDDVGSLQRNIAKDIERNVASSLNTTKASAVRALGVLDDGARDGDDAASDAEREVRELFAAVEDEAALLLVILGALDVGVVALDALVVEEEKSRASVGNGLNITVHGRGTEPPESLAAVDIHVAGLLGAAGDLAKDVAARCVVLQVGDKKRGIKLRLDIVEPRLLLLGRDSVELGKGKAEKTVALTLGKLLRNLLGSLDSLALDSQTTNGNVIGVDVARAVGAITVGYLPGSTTKPLGRGAPRGVVLGLEAGTLGLGGKDPEVRATSIKVQLERLAGANLDVDEVL